MVMKMSIFTVVLTTTQLKLPSYADPAKVFTLKYYQM